MRIMIKIKVLMIKMIEVENMMWEDVNVVSEGMAIMVRVIMMKPRIRNSSCALLVRCDQKFESLLLSLYFSIMVNWILILFLTT